MEDLELICFKIISSVGEAKSDYIMAMEEAELGNFEKANKLIEEGEKVFLKGHLAHSELITNEASGKSLNINLLLMHAEDQLMSAETIKLLATKVISLEKKLLKS